MTAIHFFSLKKKLFLTVLGLCCCARAFSSAESRGYSLGAVRRLLIAMFLFLWSTGSVVVMHGLSCPGHVGSSLTRDGTIARK